jgi:AbrB family looped-hinge helix DNA binding protein
MGEEVLHRVRGNTSVAVTTITSKGQITLPAEFRKREGFHPGDKVIVRECDGGLIVESATAAADRLYGMLADVAAGKPPATIEEWDESAAAGWADEPIEPK